MLRQKISQTIQDYRFWLACILFIVAVAIVFFAFYYANTNYCCDILITSNEDAKIEFITPSGNHFFEETKANDTLLLKKRPIKDIHTQADCEIKYSSNNVILSDVIKSLASENFYLIFIEAIILCIIIALLQNASKTNGSNNKLGKIAQYFNTNKYVLLGHFAFICMLIYATIFADERSVQSDSASQITQMINANSFVFYEKRYSAILAQLIPVILIKLNAPLKAVIVGYSLGPVIWGYIIYILCTYVLNDKKSGLIMISMLPIIQHTFFRSIAETYQLMFFATFLWVWLNHKPQEKTTYRILYYLVLAITTFLCIFIHPSSIFFVIFIILFKLTDSKSFKDKSAISAIICLAAFTSIKLLLTKNNGYDAGLVANSFGNIKDSFLNFFNLQPLKSFVTRADFYIFPITILACCLIFYARRKMWTKFSLVLGYNIAYFITAVLVYITDQGCTWPVERDFLPLAFFTMLPFAKDVLPNIKPQTEKIAFCILSVFIVFFFIRLPNTSKMYTERINEIDKIVEVAHKAGEQKLMIKPCECDTKFYEWKSFCLPNATMLISALEGPEKTVYLYREGGMYYESVNPNDSTTIRLSFQGTIDINDLNQNYFTLPKTPFCELKYNNGDYSIKKLKK